MEATARPWKIRKTNNEGARIWNPNLPGIGDIAHVYEKGKYPGWAPGTLKANAELIVRAVNSHDALVEACKALVKLDKDLIFKETTELAKQAIELAERGE